MAAQDAHSLGGDAFRELIAAGTRCLEANVEAINALNVFPVPDGDTGINMLLTLNSANDSPELPPPGSGTVAAVSHGLARGALLGARGNSGVILSQFMRGLANGLAGCTECDGPALRTALAAAAAAGYQAVGKPVEGTMLSVMRAAAEAVGSLDASPAELWRTALQAAQEALAFTPEQLPILKEAGVVDAGGQGIVAILAGGVAYLDGTEAHLEIAAPAGGLSGASMAVSHQFLEHTEEEMYGYCTQFMIQGDRLDVDSVRGQVAAIAGSTAVVGDERTVRVHAHAADPGPLLSLGASLGALDGIEIQNMDAQHRQFMARHGYTAEERAVAVVAVASGPGIERVFSELGAEVLRGGQTMNPSAADLLDAVRRANAGHTVILPNNPNIVMAAEQAVGLCGGVASVVRSRTVPEGIAALLAFNPDLDLTANVDSMTAALDGVRSGEVTTAVRSTAIEGVSVTARQAIALLDGRIVCAAATPDEALAAMIDRARPQSGALITLFAGADVPADAAAAAARAIAKRHDGVETEVIQGGQPHYHYLVSIE